MEGKTNTVITLIKAGAPVGAATELSNVPPQPFAPQYEGGPLKLNVNRLKKKGGRK